MEVRILDPREIDSFAADWDRLLTSRKSPSPFCSLDIIAPWIRHFSDSYELVPVGLFKGGEARGFMPLALANRGLDGRVLTFCGSNELYSDHLDIISAEQDSTACLDALWELLAGDALSWDLVDIALISKDSSLAARMPEASGLEWEIKQRSAAPFIDLTQGFDAFMSGFNGKHRYTLRKKANRLAEQGFKFAPCAAENIDEGIETLFRLHALRASSKEIESTFCGDRLLALHKDAARRLSDSGRLWLRFLERDSTRIGVFYGFELGGRLFYYQFGIDPEWEPHSPGTVLMYRVIEEAFSKGLTEFDFLRGSESYKYGWTKTERPLFSARAYSGSVRGQLTRGMATSKSYLKAGLKRLARRG